MGITYLAEPYPDVTPGSTGWQDCDISSYVSGTVTGAIVRVSVSTSTAGFGWRKNGSTDTTTSNGYIGTQWVFTVGVSSNIFEVYQQITGRFTVKLLGYMTSEAAYFLTNQAGYQPTEDTWANIDITSQIQGGDTAVGACFKIYTNGTSYKANLRKGGSSDDRQSVTPYQGARVIGLSSGDICEGYRSDAGTYFYLMGYIKTGHATFDTNSTEYTVSSAGSYYDLNSSLPTGATGGFWEVQDSTTTVYSFNIRVNGGSDDSYYDIQNVGSGGTSGYIMKCDANRVCEAKSENTTYVNFWLNGYSLSGTITANAPNTTATTSTNSATTTGHNETGSAPLATATADKLSATGALLDVDGAIITDCPVEYIQNSFASGSATVTNVGQAGATYNGTATDTNNYVLLSNGVKAYDLTSDPDIITVPAGSEVDNLSNITVEAIYRPDGSSTNASLWYKYQGGSSYGTISAEGNYVVVTKTNSTGWTGWRASYTFSVGKAYFIQVSWALGSTGPGSTPIIKINGVAQTVTQYNSTGNGYSWLTDASNPVKIGRKDYTSYNQLDGKLIMWRVHKVALTTEQLTTNFNAGQWRMDPDAPLASGTAAGIAAAAHTHDVEGADVCNCVINFRYFSGSTITNYGNGGSSYNGTITNGSTETMTTGYTTYKGDAENEYITVTKGSAINNQSVASWEFVISPSTLHYTTGHAQMMLHKGWMSATDTFMGLLVYLDQTGRIHIYRSASGGDKHWRMNTAGYGWGGAGGYMHVTITWDMSSISNTPNIYINGGGPVTLLNLDAGTPAAPFTDDSSYDLRLSNWADLDSSYDGRIAMFRWHNTILTSEEIATNYAADRARYYLEDEDGAEVSSVTVQYDFSDDSTTITNDGDKGSTYNATAAFNHHTHVPSGAPAYAFSGSTDKITVPAGTYTNYTYGSWGVEVGVYIDTLTNNMRIFQKSTSGADGFALYVLSTGKLVLQRRTLDSNYDTWTTTDVCFPSEDTYYYIAIRWTCQAGPASTPTIYVNNVSYALTRSSTGTGNWADDSSYSLILGNDSGGSYPFQGKFILFRWHGMEIPSTVRTQNYNASKWRLFDVNPAAPLTTATADKLGVDSITIVVQANAPLTTATADENTATVTVGVNASVSCREAHGETPVETVAKVGVNATITAPVTATADKLDIKLSYGIVVTTRTATADKLAVVGNAAIITTITAPTTATATINPVTITGYAVVVTLTAPVTATADKLTVTGPVGVNATLTAPTTATATDFGVTITGYAVWGNSPLTTATADKLTITETTGKTIATPPTYATAEKPAATVIHDMNVTLPLATATIDKFGASGAVGINVTISAPVTAVTDKLAATGPVGVNATLSAPTTATTNKLASTVLVGVNGTAPLGAAATDKLAATGPVGVNATGVLTTATADKTPATITYISNIQVSLTIAEADNLAAAILAGNECLSPITLAVTDRFSVTTTNDLFPTLSLTVATADKLGVNGLVGVNASASLVEAITDKLAAEGPSDVQAELTSPVTAVAEIPAATITYNTLASAALATADAQKWSATVTYVSTLQVQLATAVADTLGAGTTNDIFAAAPLTTGTADKNEVTTVINTVATTTHTESIAANIGATTTANVITGAPLTTADANALAAVVIAIVIVQTLFGSAKTFIRPYEPHITDCEIEWDFNLPGSGDVPNTAPA